MSKKLYARNCDVRETELDLAEDFLNKNHVQGSCEGQKVCLGLYFDNQLVGLMTFGYPRYNHNVAWELLRLCFERDTVVVGGATKLFNYFVGHSSPDNVISYCNLDLFSGKVYEEMKFKKKGSPSESFRWVKGDEWISDTELLRFGADALIGTTEGKGTDNEAIMRREGWTKEHFQTVQTFLWDSYIDGIIYKITNNINGKTYVGQSRRSDLTRWKEHCSYGAQDSAIDRAIKKYGVENFTYEVIDTAHSFYELNKKEREWIARLKPEYNKRPGGYDCYVKKMHWSEATKEKVRLYWSDPEHRKHIGDLHRGIPLSDAHKAAIAEGARRAIATPETKKRRAEANARRGPCSEEKKKKLSETHKKRAASPDFVPTRGHTGCKHSQETREQLAEISRKKWADPEFREMMVKKRKEQAKRVAGAVHWYNNGQIQVMRTSCPEGFVPGKLSK